MQSEVDYILAELIKQLVPHQAPKELDRVSKITTLSKSTLRMAQERKSINADTLLKLFLAHGVSPEVLLNLPRKNLSRVSESLSTWNYIGMNLGDKERDRLGKFIQMLVRDWKIK